MADPFGSGGLSNFNPMELLDLLNNPAMRSVGKLAASDAYDNVTTAPVVGPAAKLALDNPVTTALTGASLIPYVGPAFSAGSRVAATAAPHVMNAAKVLLPLIAAQFADSKIKEAFSTTPEGKAEAMTPPVSGLSSNPANPMAAREQVKAGRSISRDEIRQSVDAGTPIRMGSADTLDNSVRGLSRAEASSDATAQNLGDPIDRLIRQLSRRDEKAGAAALGAQVEAKTRSTDRSTALSAQSADDEASARDKFSKGLLKIQSSVDLDDKGKKEAMTTLILGADPRYRGKLVRELMTSSEAGQSASQPAESKNDSGFGYGTLGAMGGILALILSRGKLGGLKGLLGKAAPAIEAKVAPVAESAIESATPKAGSSIWNSFHKEQQIQNFLRDAGLPRF